MADATSTSYLRAPVQAHDIYVLESLLHVVSKLHAVCLVTETWSFTVTLSSLWMRQIESVKVTHSLGQPFVENSSVNISHSTSEGIFQRVCNIDTLGLHQLPINRTHQGALSLMKPRELYKIRSLLHKVNHAGTRARQAMPVPQRKIWKKCPISKRCQTQMKTYDAYMRVRQTLPIN